MYRAKSVTPEKPTTVNFFRHFPINFLRPYGVADTQMNDEKIFKRLGPVNCEWLLRPHIAMSEFADTITKNMNMLSESESQFLNQNEVANIKTKLSDFLPVLAKLNAHDSNDDPEPKDVKKFLQFMLSDDDSILQSFQQFFPIGGAMYLMGSHFCAIKALLMNPERYAQHAVDNLPEVKEFQKNATIKGLKTMLTDSCCKKETTTKVSPTKRNLASLLDSDDEEVPTKKKEKKDKKRLPESRSAGKQQKKSKQNKK